MESNKTYEHLKKVFSEVTEEVKNKFKFLSISKEDYDEIIISAIKETLIAKKTSSLALNILYKQKLIKLICQKIKEYLEKGKIEILLEYIKQELKKSSVFNECISYLSKFITFLSLINYKLTKKDAEFLYNNSDILSSLVEKIINENMEIKDKEIKDFIQKIKNEKRRKQTSITELFPGYTLEQIKDAVSRLNDRDREIVYYKYGENLTNEYCPKDMTRSQRIYFFDNIKKKILHLLENPEVTLENHYVKRQKPLVELFPGYTLEQIKEAISRLNESDRKLVYYKYGENLTNNNCPKDITKWQRAYFSNKVKKKILHLLENPEVTLENYDGRRQVPLVELFPRYTFEQIKEAISRLKDYDKKLVYYKYGESLTNKNCPKDITDWQRAYFSNKVKKKILYLLENPEVIIANQEGRSQKPIVELFPGYTLEQIKEAISRLNESDRKLVYYKYGESLTNKNCPKDITKSQRTYFSSNIKKKIKFLLENPEETYDLKGVYEYLKGYTPAIVEEAISHLDAYNRAIIYLINHNMEYLSTIFTKEQIPELIKVISLKIVELIKHKNLKVESNYSSLDHNNILNELSADLTPLEFDLLILNLKKPNIFTTEIIADMYGISEEEVISISKKVVNMYLDAVNKAIENILYDGDIQRLLQTNGN